MSFDDELTKQIQDMEGTMNRKSFVSSTHKDQGVRPKDAFVTRNDSGRDNLPLPKDNSYVRGKDKTDKSKNQHTDHRDNSGVKVKPCKYDGSTPWMDNLSHFEMCALVNNWSENQTGLYLAVSLMGQGQAVPSEKRQTLSDLVSALEEQFAPFSQSELYRILKKDVKKPVNHFPN
ncbi:unnamed protein product [Mytilus coruscus]|uniref:Uncharacterized protein n=1 Tax=Mytilus coruscus TaxID=42192 RepID=A0A6J8CWA5_MYTCO|nr:unnamed protein product [Mytilus coruscus]